MVVIGVVIAVRVLAALQDVLLIMLSAFVVALGMQPALSKLEGRGMRRGTGMALIVLAGLVVMAGLAAAIIPTVVHQAVMAFERLPEIIEDLERTSPVMADLLSGVPLPGAGDVEGGQTFEMLGGVARGIFNTVTLMLLVPYFAVSFPATKSWMFRLLRRDHRGDFVFVVNRATELTSNYIVGNLAISLIAGVVSFAGFTAIGLPYAVALAAWVAVTDLIPAFGATIGAIPVLIVAALTGGPEFVWSLLLIVVYQQIENYVIAPRVMKRAVDLSPPVVIAALLVGGTLAGVVGALLALPVAALTKIPVKRKHRGKVGSLPLP
jgi:predicted PurR-regulated permease PerM